MAIPRLSTSNLSTHTYTIRAFNHPRIIRQHLHRTPNRHASSKATAGDTSGLRPLVLEKPDAFRPPSHPARRPTRPRNFGPALSEQELEAQKTKQYPHMMPPEGTVGHYFLTSRGIHVWITISVLTALAVFTAYLDFHTHNKYASLVPPSSLFWSRPLEFLSQYITVYRMHKQAESEENQRKRQRKQDEVQKRREYMRAHGFEKEGPFGMGTVEGDEFRERKEAERGIVNLEERAREQLARELGVQREREREVGEGGGEARDVDGNVIKAKKWLGIW